MDKGWWHRTKRQLQKQIMSHKPNVSELERGSGIKLSIHEIRRLHAEGVIK